MAPNDELTRDGPVAVPLSYKVPQSGELLPLNVRATLDGTSAASSFYATLQILDPNGRLMGNYISDAIAAGASADVTWFPKLRRTGGGAGPSPNPLGTLWAWFDFSDASTVTLDGSGKVATLRDKTGNGHDLGQATASARPGITAVNGLNAGAFTTYANDQALYNFTISDPLSQPYTIAGVFTQDTIPHAANNWPGPWGGLTQDGHSNVFWNPGGGGPFFDFGSASIAGAAVPIPCTQIQVTTCANGATSFIRVNGAQTNGSGASTFPEPSIALGAQQYPSIAAEDDHMDGKVCEVLIYSGALSAAQLTAVESYLKTKWATP